MTKTIIKCPKCGGQHIIISEQMIYAQNFYVEDNKLYKNDRDIARQKEVI